MLLFILTLNTINNQITNIMKTYNKSEIFKRAHYLFRTCKSLYKTFGQALTDVWQSAIKKVKVVNERANELKIYRSYPKATSMIQADLTSEYANKPSNYYTGD